MGTTTTTSSAATAFARDGHPIAYDAAGRGARAVVMAHNLFTDRTIFAHLVARLAPRARVVAVDLRGHGASQGSRLAFSTRDLGDDLAAVMDAEGIARATLVGVSIGASASMELALARPSRVAGLVLMGATPFAAARADAARYVALEAMTRAVGVTRPFARAVLPALFGETTRRERPAAMGAWVNRVARTPRRDAALAMRAWRTRAPLVDRLRAVAAPTLVVTGDEDAACPPSHGAAIRDAVPGAELVLLPACGHTAPWEQPEASAALVAHFVDERAR